MLKQPAPCPALSPVSLASLAAPCPIWGEAKILSAPRAVCPSSHTRVHARQQHPQGNKSTGLDWCLPKGNLCRLFPLLLGFSSHSWAGVLWETAPACAVPLLGLVFGADDLDMELWNYGIMELRSEKVLRKALVHGGTIILSLESLPWHI